MVNVQDLTVNQAFLPSESILFAYFTGRCHTANIMALRSHTERLIKVCPLGTRPAVLLFVDTPATIGTRGRHTTSELITAMSGKLAAFVLCVEANWAWRSMFRSAVGAGLILSRKDYPVVVATDLEESARVFSKAAVKLDFVAAGEARLALRHAVRSVGQRLK